MTVVDVHAHVFPSISRAESRILDAEDGPWLRQDTDGAGMMTSGSAEYQPVGAELRDPRLRLDQMDRQGVDIQVVSSTPLMFGYSADTRRAAEWCELVNDRVLDLCSHTPDRLVPLCQIPLQDTGAACAEVTRAMTKGHAGVHIGNHVGNHVGDRNLDDGPIREFLTHCAEQNAAVFVHLGHARRRADAPVHAALAGRHGRGDPAEHPLPDSVRGLRDPARLPAAVLRTRRRQLRLPAGPG